MERKHKYKIGDLVELSAAGTRNKHNSSVVGLLGMIVEIRKASASGFGNLDYPYQIDWVGFEVGNGCLPMKEYEIKKINPPFK